ncbi:MAG: serine--tRNA ligase [Pseudomonadota bacterium]
MLDIRWIRENPEALDAALKKRGADALSSSLIALDEERRNHVTKVQEAQQRRNAASKEIGAAMGQGDTDKAEKLKAEVGELKTFLADAEDTERALNDKLRDALASIPNVPLDEVPIGADEDDNVEVRLIGEKPSFAFEPKEHFDLGEALGQMDFERAAKLSGSRFTVLTAGLARLERALGQFMLDVHTQEHGYTEVNPPLLVRDDAMFGTGQLPKFEEDLYQTESNLDWFEQTAELKRLFDERVAEQGFARIVAALFAAKQIERDDRIFLAKLRSELRAPQRQWLIPTAEVSLTNLVREDILNEAELPMRMTALTPCFRSEAGSAGRDTKGYLRQHQFYKVEMVSITDDETSIDELERMTKCAETILERLGLHFRTVVLCTGDMGFGARKTYDIEVWLPGQDKYREISSCSVCGDFQARRMNARYRVKDEKQPRFVHTLNGSGVAVGRALIAVMENYQNEDGSITVPEVLRPYMGETDVIRA